MVTFQPTDLLQIIQLPTKPTIFLQYVHFLTDFIATAVPFPTHYIATAVPFPTDYIATAVQFPTHGIATAVQFPTHYIVTLLLQYVHFPTHCIATVCSFSTHCIATVCSFSNHYFATMCSLTNVFGSINKIIPGVEVDIRYMYNSACSLAYPHLRSIIQVTPFYICSFTKSKMYNYRPLKTRINNLISSST